MPKGARTQGAGLHDGRKMVVDYAVRRKPDLPNARDYVTCSLYITVATVLNLLPAHRLDH